MFGLDYFGQQAYLAQSPQLYKEQMTIGLERVFEISSFYRAEKSHTGRHLSEFTSVDIEAAMMDYTDVMDVLESIVIDVFKNTSENSKTEQQEIGHEIEVPKSPFERVTYTQALEELSELDLGSKRIGISICDEKQSIATPFKTINKTNTNDLINQLKVLINENNIKGIIIGNPINMDGSLGKSAQSVNDIANYITKSIDLPVCLWDERLSTVAAFNLSSQLDVNVSKREKKIDQNAAAFILQGAIDYLNN